MASDKSKLTTKTSANKARSKKLRVEVEPGDRKLAEAAGKKLLTGDSKLKSEAEKRRASKGKENTSNRGKLYREQAKHYMVRGAADASAVAVSGVQRAVYGDDKDSSESAVESGGRAASGASKAGQSAYSNKLKESKKQKETSDKYETQKKSNTKHEQKRTIKKKYASTKRTKDAEVAAKKAGSGAKSVAAGIKEAGTKVVQFVASHPVGCLIVIIIAVVVVLLVAVCSSFTMFFGGTANTMVSSSFTAQDNDILTVEANYVGLEETLQETIDNIQANYPGYDEYQYDLAEIGHDEYELAAYLTVLYEDYTPSEVSATLQSIFDAQYTLTITPVTEIRTRTETRYREETRYRTETRTGTRTRIGPNGETITETYTYEVEVPYTVTVSYEVEVEYEYYILKTKLTNVGIGAVVQNAGLSTDQLNRYQILLATKGNKAYLFEDSIYANSTGGYQDYNVPGEYMTDIRFGNMIHEAERYLGYPYVWGGSSPSTSFDCSGFVSYVINNCGNGWNVGRQSANGLKNLCTVVSASDAKPGDLVFFEGTYNTRGASHVGIYVGDGMMIHCGNPISYASIETSYWQEHFYCFGRLP